MIEYYLVEWVLPTTSGTCDLGTGKGYGTPITCDPDTAGTFVDTTYTFTDTIEILPVAGFRAVRSISETTVELKAGLGLGTRATVSIVFDDFTGADPNPDSEALVATPSIKDKSTFFNKLNQRHYLTNKPIFVTRFSVDPVTRIKVFEEKNAYLSQTFKRNSNGTWSLTCKDAMYRADKTKSQYPNPVNARLTGDITDTETSVIIDGDIADWNNTDYVAIISGDILLITDATGNSTSVTLTCQRLTTITLGTSNQRDIENTPSEHKEGDEVFRGRLFEDAQIADVLVDIFADMGLDSSLWDYTEINDELQTWIASPVINTIFYETEDTTDVLDRICSTYLIDVWFDTLSTVSYPNGQIKVKATSPWAETTGTLEEGVNYNYNSIIINEPESKQFSRAYLQYNKRRLTQNDDDVNFSNSSLAINSSVEASDRAGEVTTKKLAKSKILGGTNNDIQVADLTASRFVQRFSEKPRVYTLTGTRETIEGINLGDVVNVLGESIVDAGGDPLQENRAQLINIKPDRDSVAGINYVLKLLTYDPFAGAVAGEPITVVSDTNINLFTQANGPTVAGEYVFIFDGNQLYESDQGQTVTTGTWPDSSTIHIVLQNGADFRAKGGVGGKGESSSSGAPASDNEDGGNGGIVFFSESVNTNLTVNIYLDGVRNVDGNNYICDGNLIAPGGGGAGGDSQGPIGPGQAYFPGGGGGGGAGRPSGAGGLGGTGGGENGVDGTIDLGGVGGEVGTPKEGGTGGDTETKGDDTLTKVGGDSGKGLSFTTGTTVNVYGTNASNFKNGSGTTPSSTPA